MLIISSGLAGSLFDFLLKLGIELIYFVDFITAFISYLVVSVFSAFYLGFYAAITDYRIKLLAKVELLRFLLSTTLFF